MWSLEATESPSQHMTSEQRLAAGIIVQAIADAVMYANDPYNLIGLDAFMWLTDEDPFSDFHKYCKVLDLYPKSVVEHLEALMTAYNNYSRDPSSVSASMINLLKRLGVI
jgi:hypothetical protein